MVPVQGKAAWGRKQERRYTQSQGKLKPLEYSAARKAVSNTNRSREATSLLREEPHHCSHDFLRRLIIGQDRTVGMLTGVL